MCAESIRNIIVAGHQPYDKTRQFYQQVGFESLITLTEMWDDENPCLVMIKSFEKVKMES